MGRIVDLCAEVAAAVEEGPEGLYLPREDFERLGSEWTEDDIEDALGLVKDSLIQGELVEAADSLSVRLLEALGEYGAEPAFQELAAGGGRMPIETVGQLARRLDRLEEILELFREGTPADRTGFDELRRRLGDFGIEEEMADGGDEEDPGGEE